MTAVLLAALQASRMSRKLSRLQGVLFVGAQPQDPVATTSNDEDDDRANALEQAARYHDAMHGALYTVHSRHLTYLDLFRSSAAQLGEFAVVTNASFQRL